MRFFAALAVVITHIELLKGQYLKPNLWQENKLVFELGALGVVFFFVLSGFLITYLLLKEKEKANTISIVKFYTRRILRIWPLYFLIMSIGFFLLPNFTIFDHGYFTKFFKENFWSNLILYILILPNLAFSFFKPVPHIGQLWSIGVEEQFYLIWPWLVKWSKQLLPVLLGVVVVCVLVKAIIQLCVMSQPNNETLSHLKTFVASLKFESMAIGGIGAWCVHNDKYYKVILNNISLLASFILILISVYFTPAVIQDGMFLVQSVLFLIIILNVSCNPKSILKIENKLFVLLGNISYGIYMYHMIIIAIVIVSFNAYNIEISNNPIQQIILYAVCLGLTVLVSWLSYNYFEKYFVRLKNKSAIIESGPRN